MLNRFVIGDVAGACSESAVAAEDGSACLLVFQRRTGSKS